MLSRLALDSCSFSFHISHFGITGGYHQPWHHLVIFKGFLSPNFHSRRARIERSQTLDRNFMGPGNLTPLSSYELEVTLAALLENSREL